MKREIKNKNKVIPEICSWEYTPYVKAKRLISPTKIHGDDVKKNKLSFPKFVIGNLHLREIKAAEVPDYNFRGRRYIKAFTLIELLVVVLIIGILSAVALPQYQKAVVKSRLATLKPIMASIKQAEEVYYLANQKYTDNESELDVSIFCKKTDDPSVFICGNFFVLDLIAGGLTASTSVIDAYYCSNKVTSWQDCTATNREFRYRVWLDYSSYPQQPLFLPHYQ